MHATPHGPADTVRFPDPFVRRMEALLGPETPSFLAALSAPETGLRVNTLRLGPERFREISPFALEPLPFPEGGFRVVDDSRPGKHPYHAAGLYYLQDPGAMVVAALLDARPGERVLDLAAAPGGKATHLAALMRGEGVLVANDVHPGRARELAGNLERMGARNAIVTSDTSGRLADRLGAWFDRVLLDAPCSGESMFHKSEAARDDWSPAAVAGCARRQVEVLEDAARMVRPGGLLVYSTCTFSPEENEGVLAEFLAAHPEFRMEALGEVPGAEPGRPDWIEEGHRHPELARALRLWPQRLPGAGHFVAGLRRGAGEEGDPEPARDVGLTGAARALWAEFSAAHLASDAVGEEGLALLGEQLVRLPAGAPSLRGLHPVRQGWWLGTLRKDRFEPAHALALGLASGDAADALHLAADDPRTAAYLRGETLSSPGPKGWVVVTVDGFPLGWAKRVGSTLKNHLPKGLRWR